MNKFNICDDMADLSRTGYITKSKSGKSLQEKYQIVQKLCGKDIELCFDINSIENDKNVLSMTEFMNQLNGVYLSPIDVGDTYKILAYAASQKQKINKNADHFLEATGKYAQLGYYGRGYECMAILPGDKVMKRTINMNALELLDNSHDLVVKLHPITRPELHQTLKRKFTNVVAGSFSAYEILKKCKKIALAGSTELLIPAVLLEKEILNISYPMYTAIGGYTELFNFLLSFKDRKERKYILLKLLNSPYSGFIFENDVIEKYITKYRELCYE